MRQYTTKLSLFIVTLLVMWPASGIRRPAAAETQKEITAAMISSYEEDLAAFKRLRGNLVQLAAKIAARPDLFGPGTEKDLTLLRPEMRQQILSLWYPVLDNYLALDELGRKYLGFFQLEDKKDRRDAFHLARGVFLTQYRVALDLITLLERNSLLDTILNEADPRLGLPKGVYAHFKYQYLNVFKAGHYAALEAIALHYDTNRDPLSAKWAADDSRRILDAGKGPGPIMTLKNGLAIIERLGHTARFPVQKSVAQWMGCTKVWRPHQYLIKPEQIRQLSQRLAPGDIFLERREWYMTNVGIPGFWTHAALYIGSASQRETLSKRPDVKKWLVDQEAESIDDLIRKRYPNAYMALIEPYKDGHPPEVIEAIAPAVSLTSLAFSAICDSLAVLRPRLPAVDRVAAVVRAMKYYGRPYDYNFDFGSDASLVCTELVVKSYLPGPMKQGLKLPVETLMGRMVTPANAFARQFDRDVGSNVQQFDLIIFLDGQEKEARALESNLEAFRTTWQRPKWHILVQEKGAGK